MNSRMKKGSAIFLQVVIVLFGMGVLTFMIWEPTVEGVNARATLFQIYFNFFVAYVYIASIPFFTGLYQAIKVLGYAGQNKVFSPEAVKALRIIKLCAITIMGFVVVSFGFMLSSPPGDDDRPQGVMMRLFVIFASIVVATAAAIFQRVLQNAVDIKSENDLTV
jgi:hypothetical protein